MAHMQKAEQRLVLQQKKVIEFKRISRAQESLMSEDAKMKRRRAEKVGVCVCVHMWRVCARYNFSG